MTTIFDALDSINLVFKTGTSFRKILAYQKVSIINNNTILLRILLTIILIEN